MTKSTLILVALVALSTRGLAGPEQYSGKEVKQVAPAPPPCPSWTGFYVGAFGGYKFGVIDPELRLGGSWQLSIFEPDVRTLTSRANDELDTSGAELGGLIGYNYQWNNWVFGLEAAGGYLWLRDSHGEGDFFSDNGNQFFVSTSFKTHYLVTVGPRFGYAFCKWMPYVTGGLALGDLDFFQQFYAPDFFGERAGGHKSETNAGWFVGGGLEYALTDHWRIRTQYQFVDLGSIGFDHDSAPSTFPSSSHVDLREHNVSFALVFGF